MTAPDALRNTTIRLNHGSVLMPAVGFGTLIPDPVVTETTTKTALEIGFRHFDCAERYRNEAAVGNAMQTVFKAGSVRRFGRVHHHQTMEQQPSPGAGEARLRWQPSTTGSRPHRLLRHPYALRIQARR